MKRITKTDSTETDKHRLARLLIESATLGMLLIVGPEVSNWKWDYGVLAEVGRALIVASILGFTIHSYLEKRIIKNVFEATLGHVFPPELRGSIRWIFGFEFMARECTLRVHLEKANHGNILLTGNLQRKLENITSVKRKIKPGLSIDEWHFSNGPSVIQEYIVEQGERKYSFTKPIERKPEKISAYTKDLTIASGEMIKTFSKWTEFKRSSDALYLAFTHPTENPTVEVTFGEGLDLDCIVEFGAEMGNVESDRYTHKWTLLGTFLPTQHIRVRWWQKK